MLWGKLVYPITLTYCSVLAAVTNLSTQNNLFRSKELAFVEGAAHMQLLKWDFSVSPEIRLGNILLGNWNGVSGFTWLHSLFVIHYDLHECLYTDHIHSSTRRTEEDGHMITLLADFLEL